MDADKITQAKREAQRFLNAVGRVEAETSDARMAFITGTPATGALRRASMDLTRALADLRR